MKKQYTKSGAENALEIHGSIMNMGPFTAQIWVPGGSQCSSYSGFKHHFTNPKQVKPDSSLDGFVPEEGWPQFFQGYLLKIE